jgi:hypothetical protein
MNWLELIMILSQWQGIADRDDENPILGYFEKLKV